MARKTQTEIILDDKDFNIIKIYDDVDPNQDIYDFIKKNGWITQSHLMKLRGIVCGSAHPILHKLAIEGKLVLTTGYADIKDKHGHVRRIKIPLFKLPPPKQLKNK